MRNSQEQVNMALPVKLTVPNGRIYEQPTGLFINNEFVPSGSGQRLTSIDPAYVPHCYMTNAC
jgi:hypothetical protein